MAHLNHLAHETSPYLQQHANNPVDWYPWNQEALDKAKNENKPILLSIGYAACHWCHVMAHESFENEEIAKLMNEHFVNIKVDREERPDLDKIYQTAHYFLTQSSGGWPLTIFLAPENLIPFFSGTYFPPQEKYQLPGFKQILLAISDIYKKHYDEIQRQNQQLLTVLNSELPATENAKLNNQPINTATQVLMQKFDAENGGFGWAPKFPNPTRIEFLMTENSPLAATALLRMAEGGIYDQLQGGFCRYSVDAKWQIPHFEKMLYDNGQLLFLYALASKQFNQPYFAEIAHETADWIISKMQSSEGGYYSSLDADSEGHEGKFYIWDKSDIRKLLNEKEWQFAENYYGLSEQPNFEKQFWHLHVANSAEKTNPLLRSIKQKLSKARAQRIPPYCDQKILTAWNSLMIKGMATAGDVLHETRYITSALQALDFIHQHLWVNNQLLVSYKDGKAHLTAYLDDHAFLLDAILTVLQIRWETKYVNFAIQLADNLLDNFLDKDAGGFFFTAENHEKLLFRPRTIMDEAIPSGNGIAAKALLTLGHLLGETKYIDAAEMTLQAAWPALLQFPAEHCSLLLALNDYLTPPETIVIRGSGTEMQKWVDYCKKRNSEVFAIPAKESNLPGLLLTRKPIGDISAYRCQGTRCSAAITNWEELTAE